MPVNRDVDNLAVICIGLMALTGGWGLQVFNLLLIGVYIYTCVPIVMRGTKEMCHE